jgi:hypothetical protein
MTDTAFQETVARTITEGRENVIFHGGHSLRRNGLRLLRPRTDIDIYTPGGDTGRDLMAQDCSTLKAAGYDIEIHPDDRNVLSATVSKGGLSTDIDWTLWVPKPTLKLTPYHKGFLTHPTDVIVGKFHALITYPTSSEKHCKDLLDLSSQVDLAPIFSVFATREGRNETYADLLAIMGKNRTRVLPHNPQPEGYIGLHAALEEVLHRKAPARDMTKTTVTSAPAVRATEFARA